MFSPVCAEGFCRSHAMLAEFLPLYHSPCFFTAVEHLRVLEHAISVSCVADTDCLWLGDREGKPSRGACPVVPVVQRSVHSLSHHNIRRKAL